MPSLQAGLYLLLVQLLQLTIRYFARRLVLACMSRNLRATAVRVAQTLMLAQEYTFRNDTFA